MISRVALVGSMLCLTPLGGCLAEENQAPYALYSASGKINETCGDTGLLAAPEEVTMRVSIRLVGPHAIHWDHGDGLMMGILTDSGAFNVSRYRRVDMREGDDTQPSCQVERQLIVDGLLKGNPGKDGTYRAFDATLTNEYRAFDGSSCDDLLAGEERIADALPCVVSYDVDGERD